MSCRRAHEIDLAAFLAEESGLEEFRAHYPQCPECAAEVGAWMELHDQLREGAVAGDPHPSPELLLRYAERRNTLGAAAMQSVDQHVAQCRECRDELATLQAFDFSVLTPATDAVPPWRERLAEIGGRLRALVVHPAFAYALALLLLVPNLARYFPRPMPMMTVAHKEVFEEDRPPIAPAREAEVRARRKIQPELPLESALEADALVLGRSPAAAPPARPAEKSSTRGLAGLRKEEFADVEGRIALEAAPAAPSSADEVRSLADSGSAASFQLTARTASVHEPPWLAVRIDPGREVAVLGPISGLGVSLQIAHPTNIAGASEVEVRVVSPDGRKEMSERFDVAGETQPLEIRLPAVWLSPGDYRVEVRVRDGGSAGPEIPPATLSVR